MTTIQSRVNIVSQLDFPLALLTTVAPIKHMKTTLKVSFAKNTQIWAINTFGLESQSYGKTIPTSSSYHILHGNITICYNWRKTFSFHCFTKFLYQSNIGFFNLICDKFRCKNNRLIIMINTKEDKIKDTSTCSSYMWHQTLTHH